MAARKKKKTAYYVYALVGGDGRPWYYGMTNNPQRRWKEHQRGCVEAQSASRSKYSKLAKVVGLQMVIMAQLESKSEARWCEAFVISWAKLNRWPITNTTLQW